MSYKLPEESVSLLKLKTGLNISSDNPFLKRAEIEIAALLPVISELDSVELVQSRWMLLGALAARQRETFIELNGDAFASDDLETTCTPQANDSSVVLCHKGFARVC